MFFHEYEQYLKCVITFQKIIGNKIGDRLQKYSKKVNYTCRIQLYLRKSQFIEN